MCHDDHVLLLIFFFPFFFSAMQWAIIECFLIDISENGKQLQIIHNYGHGGSGVTLSYGCAIEVGDIVNDIMTNANTPKSKL